MENYSIRQLSKISGYSGITLTRIKDYWLEQSPKETYDYSKMHYLIFDATYFHKDGCLLNLMEAPRQRIIAHQYVNKESFKEAYPWFLSLKQQGLDPWYITTDGERSVLRAMRLVWPQARLQRCLYHLQHEGMRWLRSYPKTEAGKKLRELLSRLSWIKSISERDTFIREYGEWLGKHEDFVKALPKTTVAYKDLKRTIVLINNALPDMFYYLEDRQVHSTTNTLEGFHSRLKADYQRHRGLTKEHRISYIYWYCYFKNKAN
jgi:transposase-like protein